MPRPEGASTRELRHKAKVTGIFAASILAGVGLGVFTTVARLRDLPPWSQPLAAAVVLVFGFALTVYYWRQLDETARAAHLEAFFWGGLGGMTLVLIASIGAYAYREEISRQFGSAAMSIGLYGGMFCIVVGYGAAWVFWWLRRR